MVSLSLTRLDAEDLVGGVETPTVSIMINSGPMVDKGIELP